MLLHITKTFFIRSFIETIKATKIMQNVFSPIHFLRDKWSLSLTSQARDKAHSQSIASLVLTDME